MIRHLVVMHGWTDDEVLNLIASAAQAVWRDPEVECVVKTLEGAHDNEHWDEHGEYNDLAYPERQYGEFHAHPNR